jgi:uncharacterized protein (TIGR00730 family)
VKIRSLCVFCASSDAVPASFREDAEALAGRLAERGITLVYGGGSIGLMGALAGRLLALGGRVEGVIPSFLVEREYGHRGLSELVVTATMHERKAEMARRADAFAVLPGGMGTLDEFFEILTWRQLGLHDRPVVVANTGGWFDPLLDWFRKSEGLGTVSPRCASLFDVVPSAPLVVDALDVAAPRGKGRSGDFDRG